MTGEFSQEIKIADKEGETAVQGRLNIHFGGDKKMLAVFRTAVETISIQTAELMKEERKA